MNNYPLCPLSSLGRIPVPTPAITASSAPIQLAKPEKFSGDSGDCRPFEMDLELQAPQFPTEQTKIAYMISHLTGRAEARATAEWTRCTALCESFSDFSLAFAQIFLQFFSRSRGSLITNLPLPRSQVSPQLCNRVPYIGHRQQMEQRCSGQSLR